jgi:uncharacterized protein
MSEAQYPPQPAPDFDTEGFWTAAADGTLAVCRCIDCGLWLHPPLESCRRCEGATAFEPVAGTGTLYSFIVQRQPSVVGYLAAIPYVVALVDLDGAPGVRLPARIVDIDTESITVGMPVAVQFVELAGGEYTVPVFGPPSVT